VANFGISDVDTSGCILRGWIGWLVGWLVG
jgi:hypothetical protein